MFADVGIPFLSDCTVALMLQACICRRRRRRLSVRNVLWLNGASYSKSY